jgi:inhibitor of cysteine peptidase
MGNVVEVRIQGDMDKSWVEMSRGDKLILHLEANPSTGYQWQVDTMNGDLLDWVDGPSFVPSAPSMVGSGGTSSFGFNALREGRTSLRLVYRRPWEEGKPPIRTVVLKVRIK